MVGGTDSDILFKFQFAPLKTNKPGFSFKIYTQNQNMMELFLSQHNFDRDHVYIECISITQIPETELNKLEDSILKVFRFKSNSSTELFHIITTDFLVSNAIDQTCSELSETLLLGPPSLRTDIEILNLVNELLNELPHVYILDHSLIDGDSGNLDEIENENRYTNRVGSHLYDGFMLAEGCSDSLIYDSMYDSSSSGEVQPITIESYVNAFSTLLVDKYF